MAAPTPGLQDAEGPVAAIVQGNAEAGLRKTPVTLTPFRTIVATLLVDSTT